MPVIATSFVGRIRSGRPWTSTSQIRSTSALAPGSTNSLHASENTVATAAISMRGRVTCMRERPAAKSAVSSL